MGQLEPSGGGSTAAPASAGKTATAAAAAAGRQQQQWQSGVFAVWSDPPTTVMGLLAPCCLVADNVSRLDGRYGVPWCTGCAWAFLFPLLSYWLVGSNVRAQLREQLDLPGSARSDCLLHALFCCCAICQEAREIKYRSELRVPRREGAELLQADMRAPRIQYMRAGSSPKAAATKEQKHGGNGSSAAAGASGGEAAAAAALVPPRQAKQMEAVLEAAAEGLAEEVPAPPQQEQPATAAEPRLPAPPAAEAAAAAEAAPVSEAELEGVLRAQSMRVDMAVRAARRIEREATMKEQR